MSGLAGAAAELSRALIHGLGWAVLVATLAPAGSAVAAFLGGVVGALVGAWLAKTQVRTLVIAGAGTLLLVVVAALHASLIERSGLAEILGPVSALRMATTFTALLTSLTLSGVMRACSKRRAVFGVFELLLVAVAFAQLLVPHRHGAINRPFYLADWIIAVGWDPTWLFLFVGGTATVLGLVLLLREQRFGRAVLNLGIIAVLLAFIVVATPLVGMPPPPEGGGGLGLRPESGDSEEGEGKRGESRSGPANGELEFRDKYNTGGDRVPVAVVLFHDDYSPPSGVYYFRQGAFSQYNGRKLVVSGRRDIDRDLIRVFPGRPTEIENAPAMNENRGPLETSIALMADHMQPFALEAPVEVAPLQNPSPNRFRRVYKVMSAVLTADYATLLGASLGSPAWSKEQWAHYTETPADSRYRELASDIVSALPDDLARDPMAQAFAVTAWLGEEGIYSLKNQHSAADDPTASFLFGDRTGYCVHFAHAAVYLMRSLGVPARVATGYAVSEAAREGGSALLLSGAASHAWPEVYVDGFGWVVFDVYPERALDPPAPPMDADLQRLLGELARGASPIPISATDLPRLRELARDFTLRTGTWLLILLLTSLAFLYLVKAWRRVAPAFASESSFSRVAYRAELDRIAELSMVREPGESREAFARRLHDRVPSFEALTATHVAAAFGGPHLDPPSVRDQAARVRGDLLRGFSWWRRFLGLITPWSWLRSK